MLDRWDMALHSWMQAHQHPWATALLRAVSIPTSGEAIALWAALIGAGLAWRRQFRLLAALTGGTYLGLCLTPLLKNFFERLRPLVEGRSLPTTFAFPSGHVLSVTIFGGLLAWWAGRSDPRRRRLYQAGAGVLILATAVSRVYLGYHWGTDVLAGFLVGVLYLIAWTRFAERRLCVTGSDPKLEYK